MNVISVIFFSNHIHLTGTVIWAIYQLKSAPIRDIYK